MQWPQFWRHPFKWVGCFGGGYQDAHGEKGRGVQSLVVFYQKCQLCEDGDVIKIITASGLALLSTMPTLSLK